MPPKGSKRTTAAATATKGAAKKGAETSAASKRASRLSSVPPPTNDLPLAAATAALKSRINRANTSEPEEPRPKRHDHLIKKTEITAKSTRVTRKVVAEKVEKIEKQIKSTTTKTVPDTTSTSTRTKRARTVEVEEPKAKRPAAGETAPVAEANGHAIVRRPKRLFSAKASSAHFNPLPIHSTVTDQLSHRCANPLNSLDFEKNLSGLNDETKLLVFGGGEMGQMGLGPEKFDNVKRPAVHPGIETMRVEGQLGGADGYITDAAGGGGHTLLVDAGGRVWSWGINDNAALGRQTEGIPDVEQEEYESRPMKIDSLMDMNFQAVRVAAGDSVSIALSVEGELRAWGSFRSSDGLLGFDSNVGTETKQYHPTRVSNVSEWPVAQVVCGYDHVLALTTHGRVYSWGNGQQHQLGRRIIERRKINGLTPERLGLKHIVLVGSGGYHSFAVHENGTVYGWGLNSSRQLGIDSEDGGEEEIVSVPTEIKSMHPNQHNGSRVIAIEGGDFHTMFLLSNGQVWTVGDYSNRAVGLSLSHPQIVSVERERKEGEIKKKAWIEEELKRRRIVVEEQEDEMWDELIESVDANEKAGGQGFVPPTCISKPALVEFNQASGESSEVKIIDIAAGSRHCLVVDHQGRIFSWGMGQNSQLGLVDEDKDEVDEVATPTLLKSKALDTGIKAVRCLAGGYAQILLGYKEKVDTDVIMEDAL